MNRVPVIHFAPPLDLRITAITVTVHLIDRVRSEVTLTTHSIGACSEDIEPSGDVIAGPGDPDAKRSAFTIQITKLQNYGDSPFI
jgi:hypothetical protein